MKETPPFLTKTRRICVWLYCCLVPLLCNGEKVVLVEDAVVPALREAVPELHHYKTDSGLPFRCSKLPSLRLCIHTGLDRETALLHFRSALLYSPPISPLDKINGEVRSGAGSNRQLSYSCAARVEGVVRYILGSPF